MHQHTIFKYYSASIRHLVWTHVLVCVTTDTDQVKVTVHGYKCVCVHTHMHAFVLCVHYCKQVSIQTWFKKRRKEKTFVVLDMLLS